MIKRDAPSLLSGGDLPSVGHDFASEQNSFIVPNNNQEDSGLTNDGSEWWNRNQAALDEFDAFCNQYLWEPSFEVDTFPGTY